MANYAFDRIKSIEDANVTYKPTDVNWFDYFDEMIGVSKDTRTEPQKVLLWVSNASWPYVKTKPLHGATQRLVNMDETGAYITIEVYLNYELEQQILSFGENMKVLEPVELKERIKKRLGGAILNYVEKVQNG
jgi:Predicted transcriptional regulator